MKEKGFVYVSAHMVRPSNGTHQSLHRTEEIKKMATSTFTFPCAVRGFHYYKRIWEPQIDDDLDCEWERGNFYDRFAIKTVDNNSRTVGHLPLEISRVTKHLIDRGATVCARISSTKYRPSPLVQGGLEIPCFVTVSTTTTFDDSLK